MRHSDYIDGPGHGMAVTKEPYALPFHFPGDPMTCRSVSILASVVYVALALGGPARAANLGFEAGYDAGGAAEHDSGARAGPPPILARPGEFDAARADARADALVEAIRSSNPVRVRALLAAGAPANGTEGADGIGRRPLLDAVSAGDREVARLLLERGAHVDVKGPEGRTPLGIAALRGHVHMVRLLLQAGADIDARGDNGNTPLLDAVQLDRLGVVRVLLAFQPDLRRPNREGLPAVALAAREGHTATLAALLDHGADMDIVDRSGHPALFWAVARKQRATVALLVERGAKVGAMSVDALD